MCVLSGLNTGDVFQVKARAAHGSRFCQQFVDIVDTMNPTQNLLPASYHRSGDEEVKHLQPEPQQSGDDDSDVPQAPPRIPTFDAGEALRFHSKCLCLCVLFVECLMVWVSACGSFVSRFGRSAGLAADEKRGVGDGEGVQAITPERQRAACTQQQQQQQQQLG